MQPGPARPINLRGPPGPAQARHDTGYKYFIIVLGVDSFKAYGYLRLLDRFGFQMPILAACAAYKLRST